uniref:N-acylneuraminate-9-phosphatase n=1 Tax=Auxenochlorella protothecoides TaxID=3075 RepID=A0A1D2ABA5_AUXPR
MVRVRAVFLDLDDTLVLTSKGDVRALEEVAQAASQHCPAVDPTKLLADWRQLFKEAPWDPTHQVDVEEWRTGLWLQALQAQSSVVLEEAAATAAALQRRFCTSRIEAFRFLPAVASMLGTLRSSCLTTVIITNGHSDVQASKLEACGARNLVDYVIIGGDEVAAGRYEKPHRSIYDRACQLAGCTPDQAIMVGDNYICDVVGGQEAGLLATVWINETGKAVPEGAAVMPTFTVSSVVELPALIDQLNAGPPR